MIKFLPRGTPDSPAVLPITVVDHVFNKQQGLTGSKGVHKTTPPTKYHSRHFGCCKNSKYMDHEKGREGTKESENSSLFDANTQIRGAGWLE